MARIACFTAVLFSVFFFNGCKKDNKQPTKTPDTISPSMVKYDGPCPYPCGDTRCFQYSDPYANCQNGSERICGSEFTAMGLNGATYSAAVDSIGKWHNDYQKYLFSTMKAKNITLSTDTLQSFLKNVTDFFFASKGITPQNTSISNRDVSDTTWQISAYSTQAQSILNQLKALVDNYTVSQHSSFITQCSSLKTQALNLQLDKEALSVGLATSVAINSFTYWKDSADSWQNYLVSTSTGKLYRVTTACNINLKSLGGADISGAVGGAVGGGIGAGPAGAVAGGILGGAVGSSYNVLGQALKCMPGTVGRVSRWLSDWF